MALNELLADQFEKIFSGLSVDEQIGDWSLHMLPYNAFFVLEYKQDMTYGFSPRKKKEALIFINFHRKANTLGAGTISLRQLEPAFQTLASRKNQTVMVIFNPCGQKDTETWMEKNNYQRNKKGEYVKEFKPAKYQAQQLESNTVPSSL